LILALIFLHFLHTVEMVSQGEHNFFYHWTEAYPPAHALAIISLFVLTGILLAVWRAMKDQLKIQELRIKTLEEISQAKTEMVALVSHQIRAPLTAVRFSIKMLLEGDFGKLTEAQQEILTKTYRTSENLRALIDEFLDVSKLEMGRAEIYLKNICLADLEKEIKQIVEGLKPLIEEKNIVLNFSSFLAHKFSVQADLKRINQVVENLLENAVSYTVSGGEIKIILENDKENFKFSVSDTGIGIPKEARPKIFSKFFRAANARKLRSAGTGLGLYLSKKIIEGHQGKIWFISEEGKGTTFSFTIPLRARAATEELFRKI